MPELLLLFGQPELDENYEVGEKVSEECREDGPVDDEEALDGEAPGALQEVPRHLRHFGVWRPRLQLDQSLHGLSELGFVFSQHLPVVVPRQNCVRGSQPMGRHPKVYRSGQEAFLEWIQGYSEKYCGCCTEWVVKCSDGLKVGRGPKRLKTSGQRTSFQPVCPCHVRGW